MAKLTADPRRAYHYAAERAHPNAAPETLLRGRGLGGSSTLNGIVYHRGQPQDYDDWAELGLPGWGWKDVLPCFLGMEDNPLPQTEWRGRGGPIPLRIRKKLPPMAQALMSAGPDLGLPIKEEPNLPQQLGISAIAENIDHLSRRVSSAHAFLPPAVRRRPNLRIMVETRVDRILFEGRRAVGVRSSRGGVTQEFRANKCVVLCAGALENPRILQISGVGPQAHLASLDVRPVVDLPGVGANYRDHLCYQGAWRLRHPRDSENREFRGWRLMANLFRYYALRGGPMGTASNMLAIFPEVLPGRTGRADVEFVWAPWSLSARPTREGQTVMEDEPGCTFNGFPLRGTSQGTVMAQSPDPAMKPIITPNYLVTNYDRAVMLGLVRFNKTMMNHPDLKPFIVGPLGGLDKIESDDEVIDYVLRTGYSAQHGCGTCKMAPESDPMAVLDARLSVRGLQGLKVADCSVMPSQISGNTNAPAMMIGWRLSEMMQEDLRTGKFA